MSLVRGILQDGLTVGDYELQWGNTDDALQASRDAIKKALEVLDKETTPLSPGESAVLLEALKEISRYKSATGDDGPSDEACIALAAIEQAAQVASRKATPEYGFNETQAHLDGGILGLTGQDLRKAVSLAKMYFDQAALSGSEHFSKREEYWRNRANEFREKLSDLEVKNGSLYQAWQEMIERYNKVIEVRDALEKENAALKAEVERMRQEWSEARGEQIVDEHRAEQALKRLADLEKEAEADWLRAEKAEALVRELKAEIEKLKA